MSNSVPLEGDGGREVKEIEHKEMKNRGLASQLY